MRLPSWLRLKAGRFIDQEPTPLNLVH